jgi:hypothetical protein
MGPQTWYHAFRRKVKAIIAFQYHRVSNLISEKINPIPVPELYHKINRIFIFLADSPMQCMNINDFNRAKAEQFQSQFIYITA